MMAALGILISTDSLTCLLDLSEGLDWFSPKVCKHFEAVMWLLAVS